MYLTKKKIGILPVAVLLNDYIYDMPNACSKSKPHTSDSKQLNILWGEDVFHIYGKRNQQ